jgi:hypothetical protein
LRATVHRNANGAESVADTLVKIANVAATVGVSQPAARLRSGGNDGTDPQDHTITITATQELFAAPTLGLQLDAGAWQGAAFADGPKIWTRALRVLDSHLKGEFNWGPLVAVNLSGIPTTALTGGETYILGGFVARDIAFPTFSQEAALNAEVVDYAKLKAGLWTATALPSIRMPVQGDGFLAFNRFTVLEVGVYPATLWWNDSGAAATNDDGTAMLLAIEETV